VIDERDAGHSSSSKGCAMRWAIARCVRIGCAALTWVACNGQVALNGLEPVDAAKAPAPLETGAPPSSENDGSAPDSFTETAPPDNYDSSLGIEEGDDGSYDAPHASSCGPQNCGGCCSADGTCVGGQSAATCGQGGESCTDCTATGQICVGGSCIADSGAPRCTSAASCAAVRCIPVYQAACCKTEGTCGCSVTTPPGPCL
jgi:hypothetical protein